MEDTKFVKFRKVKCIDSYFDKIDTEKKAYLLGFLIADGCISIDYKDDMTRKPIYRIYFNNSIDDIEILNHYRLEICPEKIIHFRDVKQGAKNRKTQANLRFTSRYMCDSLEELYGIKPRKTYNSTFKFPFEKIPEEMIRHFTRGFFDGDGSVSFYKYNKSIFFNFSFVLNSIDFTNQIAEIFESKFNIISKIYSHEGKISNYFTLRFNYNRKRTEKIKEIYDWLYNNSTIFLKRKKIKFEEYFKYRANCSHKQWIVV